MIYKYDKNLVVTAKALRKNMTPEEKRLWYVFLKRLPITVNRQKNIVNYTLVTIKKFMDIIVMGEERRIVADDSASIRLSFFAFIRRREAFRYA